MALPQSEGELAAFVERLIDERTQAAIVALQGGWLTGDLKATALAAAPAGWLLCDGSPVTTANAALRSALIAAGSPYGTSGADPRLPDLRGRMPMGAGTAAGAGGATAHALGSMGGEETHALLAAESGLPAHGHSLNNASNVVNASGGAGTNITQGGGAFAQAAVTVNNNAAADAVNRHNTLPPFTAVNWLVKL